MSQITTLSEIEIEWGKAGRESDKRALWRVLARGGWLQACRDAVQKGDRATLEAWLKKDNTEKQDIIHFTGAEAAQVVSTHLLCGVAACQTRERAPRELIQATWESATSQANAMGFCRDLTQELLGESLRQMERGLSLAVLLVDTARNEGVVATLTLELVSGGHAGLYPVPELAFIRDTEFRRAEEHARSYIESIGLSQQSRDIRWRLRRNDGLPLVNLSGPSMGAAFALGIGKLCAQESASSA
jgi:hypothetical protein